MVVTNEDDVWLFSYGTLRQHDVQLATFGRELEGQADVLSGYNLTIIEITDPDVIATSGTAFHPMVKRTDDPHDTVAGMAFRITQVELSRADAYEVADYKRVAVRLASGIEAYVYVNAD